MRREVLAALSLVAMLSGLSLPVLAQLPDGSSTDLEIELKKQRSVVRPPADTAAAANEAAAATRRMEEQRRADELRQKAMSTVEGSHGKQLRELPKR